ncbi:MAG: Ig-like domain-containing protein, partial [Chloroflexi bacterium]|nr:Ig-like domain-containing protein [Chloroflexota bacterium]
VTLGADGAFTYTPAANYNGADSFTYTATDTSGATSSPATVTVTVTAVNDTPVAVGDTASTAEDTPVSGTVLANDTDVEGDTLTATLDTGPAHGSVTLGADGAFTYTPAANYNGSDSLPSKPTMAGCTANMPRSASQ